MTESKDVNSLSQSLVYLVSPAPRGGDNYWARVINGTDKVYLKDYGTASVSITPNGRYILTVDIDFFNRLSAPLKKLVLIHEAGHLALRHIERFIKILANMQDPIVRSALINVANYAMDFCVNDQLVRTEKEFAACHLALNEEEKSEFFKKFKEDTGPITQWPFFLPEEFGFPKGKTMWEYMKLMLKDLPRFHQQVTELLKQMGEEAEGDESGDGDGEGDEEGSGGSGSGMGGKGRGKGKGSSNGADDNDPTLPEGLAGKAKAHPEKFSDMEKLFDKLNRHNHDKWNEAAEKMNPQEAVSASNKLKNHARRLVKTAHDQTMRSRGTVPAGIEQLVKDLLEPEQVPWTWLFQDVLASSIASKVIEEMASPNMSLLNLDYIEPWPGNTVDFAFNVTWITDTSGSVSDREYARACNELNALLRINKSVKVRYLECDAAIQKEEITDNIQPPDEVRRKELQKRRGYGGTVYTPVFRRLCGVDQPGDWACEKPLEDMPKPDLVVVYTDGGVVIQDECFPQYHPGCPIIWLLAPNCHPAPGMDDTPPDRLIKMFHIKNEED